MNKLFKVTFTLVFIFITTFTLVSCNKVNKEQVLKEVIENFEISDEVMEDFYLIKKEQGVKITWSVLESNYPVTLIHPSKSDRNFQNFRVVRMTSNHTYQLKGVFKYGKYEGSKIFNVKVIGLNPNIRD